MKTTRSAMFFFQVSPFTDMKKRDGFLVCQDLYTYCILFFFLLDSENKEAHL